MYYVHGSELSYLPPQPSVALRYVTTVRMTCTTRPEFYYSTDSNDEFIGYACITQWLPRSPVASLLAVTSYVTWSPLMENHFAGEQPLTTAWRPLRRKSKIKNIGILYTYNIYYTIYI